jgi:hypothetical protein
MRKHLPTTLIASLVVLAVAPTHASARKDQVSIIQDDARVLSGSTREATLDEMKGLGADVVKVTVFWRDVAADQPANGEDPGAYPAAKWATYDSAIQGIVARGLQPFVDVSGPAPDWATPKRSDPPGAYRPNAGEFGKFAKAVGTRYSGSGALPAVRLWSVWNEPNLPRFLLPQRGSDRRHTPVSPTLYRRLYLAARSGLGASGHGSDTILMGELLPVGKSSRSPRSSLRPLEFLRELACVDRHFRAYRGSAAKARGCKGYKAIPVTGVAYHPYALAGGPTRRPPNRDDASIGTLSRVTRTLDRLRSHGRFSGPKRIPLWLTEFGVQTDPPDFLFGAPIKRVPGYLGLSERLAFRNSRVRSYSQYPLVDDSSNNGFQSGLRFSNGKPKPGVYAEYRMPIYVTRSGSSSVHFFGGVRAADGGGSVVLESKRGKGKWTKLKTVELGARGYFNVRARASGASRRQYRFSYGTTRSIVVVAH